MSYSINDLPVELLIDIMRRLDQRSLKAAILTCQHWKDVIETHCSWSINLRTGRIAPPALNMLLETKRKIYIKLLVTHRFYNDARPINDDFKKIAWRVTALTFEYIHLDSLWFLELLKCLTNLEYIDGRNVIIPKKLDTSELPELQKLKSLKTRGCEDSIFKCFRTSNLKCLEIQLHGRLSSTSALENVANFIRRQANLTKLKTEYCEDMLFEQLSQKTANGNVPFRLTELVIFPSPWLKYSTGLIKFVKIHSDTLRKFNLERTFKIPVYELILGEFKKLKYLSLHSMPEEYGFYESLKINTSIENLQLITDIFSLTALQLLCKCVPNVKNLTLWGYFNADQLEILSTTLRKVTTLCVCDLSKSFNKIQFPNLASFHIEHLNNRFDNRIIYWDTLTKANSTITEITVNRVYGSSFTSDHVETITSNLKLQTLKIGEGFVANDRFLSIINKNCSDLKVLELHKSCGIQNLQWIDGCAASLRLCNQIKFRDKLL